MHFSTATVLSTLAVAGNVAASNLHHGHAQFHAKRDAEKRDDYAGVNWDVALKDVDWSTVKYTSDAPAATQPASKPEAKPEAQSTYSAAAPPAPKPSSSKAPAPSASSKPSTDKLPSVDDIVGDIADAWSKTVSTFSNLNVQGKSGFNAEQKGDAIWIGKDGKYKATFTNDDSKDMAIICWNHEGMWIEKDKPQIYVTLKGGKSVTLSIPEGMSGGCGAASLTSDTWYGLINESILEFTAKDGAMGCFDVSREINQQGLIMTAKGSQCTSGYVDGQLSCVFVCKDKKVQRCKEAKSYGITLGAASKGSCMQGNDPWDDGASGGCQFGTNGEHIQVTVSSSRAWPEYKDGDLHI